MDGGQTHQNAMPGPQAAQAAAAAAADEQAQQALLQQQDALLAKKYGNLAKGGPAAILARGKKPVVPKFFDSADWALANQRRAGGGVSTKKDPSEDPRFKR